jgi:hypothetical protein
VLLVSGAGARVDRRVARGVRIAVGDAVNLPEISPHDLDAERAVLGAVLVNNAALVAVERIPRPCTTRQRARGLLPGWSRPRGDNVDTSPAADVSRDRAYDAASR